MLGHLVVLTVVLTVVFKKKKPSPVRQVPARGYKWKQWN